MDQSAPNPEVASRVHPQSEGQKVLTRVDQVGDVLDAMGTQSVFLVVDRSAYELSGAQSQLVTHWRSRDVFEFDAFECNPSYDDVVKGVEAFRRTPCSAIIAIGGGTALDVAKLVRCCAGKDYSLADIVANSRLIEKTACPLIAVTTTAGTGSEATHFAVVYCDGVKHSIAHESMTPEVAVVDWRLTRSLPPPVTAVTGLDAFCQSVESTWSINSTPESISYSIEALRLIANNLQAAVLAPTDGAREAMSAASHLAGKAINISKTTAPHAISYKITHDYGIPHGHAAAMTLGAVLEFNTNVTDDDVLDPRGVTHVRTMMSRLLSELGCSTATDARMMIAEWMESIGCATRLCQLGIDGSESLADIARSVNQQRLRNNPRRLSQEQLLQLLESIK